MNFRELKRIVSVKPEPQTTPTLAQAIERGSARKTVSDYHFTPALKTHFRRMFDCLIHRKGQGFWVQAEYGAGKTHFLGALIDLLVWSEEKVWEVLGDSEIRQEYAGPLLKVRMFPVAFSLRGLGEAGGSDSLMRIFEEQVIESIKAFAPHLEGQVKITSQELAAHWYAEQATDDEKAGAANFFSRECKCTPEDYRKKFGPRKFGQELIRSRLPEGRLRGKFKERFAFIYEQITKLGGYDGMLFVVDEFRSWQDRHPPGTASYAEDEEVLETLAFVLPTQGLNIITVIASQGDMPQKLSGGGAGDRFIPLYLLADKNKSDFGEIVVFRARELRKGAATDIKDYYDYCRKEYKFIRQSNVSLDYFTAIFPFQPRCFDVMRRITQNAEQHSLPTARSAIRMAWQTLSNPELLAGTRLITLSDIVRSDELQKGLNHEHYRDGYRNLCGAIEQLSELDVAPEEREQAGRVMETLYLWSISLPDNLRDGLTAQEVAEAAWLLDDFIGPTAQAEQLLERLVQTGFPIRQEKKTRDGKEVAVYSYEISVAQESPVRYFAPLKKKAKEDIQAQNAKWIEGLFWQLPDITKQAQENLGVNGGILCDFSPTDQRADRERREGSPAVYQFLHTSGSSTRRIHKVAYSGEVVVSDRWRDEFGKEIENPDQHFRLVYLGRRPEADDEKIGASLQDSRIAVIRPDALNEDTRDALADLIAAEQMKRNCAAPNQAGLRVYAEGKRNEAVEALLKCQLDEYRRGKIITQKGYAIKAIEIFRSTKGREEDLAGRLLDKAYDTPLFSPKEFKKDFTDADARKVFAGLFHKEPAKAEMDAVQNFAAGLELVKKSHPAEFNPAGSQALARIRDQVKDRTEMAVSELNRSLCRPPYGLTDSMVALYMFSLIRSGGFEFVLKPNSGVILANGRPLPGDRLNAHNLSLCDWNAKLDRAMPGCRLMKSIARGWNDVLPYARVLDPRLKPSDSPDEEQARNEALLRILAKLKTEVPEVDKGVADLGGVLKSAAPQSLKEVCARLLNLASAGSYQDFDAAARESYPERDQFVAAYQQYEKAHKVRDRAFSVSQMVGYLEAARAPDESIEFDRTTLLTRVSLDSFLTDPSLIIVCEETFERWKKRYVHSYRKAHRAHYEAAAALRGKLDELRPRASALARMNRIVELGPPAPATVAVLEEVKKIEGDLWGCPDAEHAEVEGTEALCPKCRWHPGVTLPDAALSRLDTLVAKGLGERFLRFKDAAISSVLKKAAVEGRKPGLKGLLDIIQLTDADRLAAVLNDDLTAFLRQVLYDENLVDEQVPLAPIIEQIGAIEDARIDDAVSKVADLLTTAIRNAKAKHPPNRRVRIFLTLDAPSSAPAAKAATDSGEGP
jgi:hypothetical protein